MVLPEQKESLENLYYTWLAENHFKDRPANVVEFLAAEWLLDEVAIDYYFRKDSEHVKRFK